MTNFLHYTPFLPLAQVTFLCYTVPMKYLTYDEFKKAAAIITEFVPFELILRTQPDGTQAGYVPYIMNDSMECYMVLENCRIVGSIIEDHHGPTQVEFADHTMGISVRQDKNVYTAWFTGIRQYHSLYRYHEIGHFWQNTQEQWRRLVYMIGTIYDKLKFSPEPACTDTEIRLSKIMEFSPFRVYSPVSESILSLYPETREGAQTFAALAEEAGDKALARIVRLYDRFPNPLLAIHIANRLAKPKSEKLYHHLFDLVCRESSRYGARDYGTERNGKIQAAREKATAALHREGFSGAYPLFRRDGMEVLAAEEHPFTILETDDYHFRIRFMVSEYPPAKVPKGICGGFFSGKHRKGYIFDAE